MDTVNLAKQIKTASDNAKVAGFTPINYGKLTTTASIVTSWIDGRPQKRLVDEGENIAGKEIELNFSVNLSELNPRLEFNYERWTQIKKSGNGKLTNWSEITLPSLVATFGENWSDSIFSSPYVAVEDVEDINGASNKDGKIYKTVKFLEKFNSLAECKAARDARFGGSSGTDSTSGSVPPEIVKQVKTLLQSLSGNVDVVKGIISTTPPHNQYDADLLIALAQQ